MSWDEGPSRSPKTAGCNVAVTPPNHLGDWHVGERVAERGDTEGRKRCGNDQVAPAYEADPRNCVMNLPGNP